ncbi:hypothetical protein CISIN_1g033966mg [Citrus sinensis]|uniref:Uncharacterized protein n=1 Tax=Citrus sinensis TaxID=2711 RepID=A0A067DB31_CITSI|nr:hypothetical protein CISIN_1g033966mg [Citrus sinensis]
MGASRCLTICRMPMLLPIVYQFVTLVKLPEELLEGKPSLDTNLIAGVLPAEILARCEFLEPLSEATLSDYEWLVVNLQKPAPVLMKRVQHYLSSLIQSFLARATLKS